MCKFKFCRMNNIYLSLRLGFNIIENGPIIYANVVGFFFFGSNLNLGYFVKMFTLFDWYLHYTNDPVHKILDCFRKFS